MVKGVFVRFGFDSVRIWQFEQKSSRTKQRDNTSENPARPNGVKITRDCMVIEYQSYKTCTEYPVRMSIAKAKAPKVYDVGRLVE